MSRLIEILEELRELESHGKLRDHPNPYLYYRWADLIEEAEEIIGDEVLDADDLAETLAASEEQ